MDLYIAECYDRHVDHVIRVFDTPDAAIAYAKQFVKDNARFPEEVCERVRPWALYYATFSNDGDYVMVKKGILNDDD